MEFKFNKEGTAEIQRLAAIKRIEPEEVLTKALALYRFAIDETSKGPKLALVEGDGVVLSIVNLD